MLRPITHCDKANIADYTFYHLRIRAKSINDLKIYNRKRKADFFAIRSFIFDCMSDLNFSDTKRDTINTLAYMVFNRIDNYIKWYEKN